MSIIKFDKVVYSYKDEDGVPMKPALTASTSR
jgi:hypothetical protein